MEEFARDEYDAHLTLDFEEFLWAMGNGDLMDMIRESFAARKPMGQAMHRRAMEYFREYMVVGGMPQVVVKYASGRLLATADREKRKILALYRDDIAKHAKRHAGRVRRIFDEIPSQLSKHEKRFTLSSLSKNAMMRTYEYAFLWLDDAMIVNTCYNATDPGIGLRLNQDSSAFNLNSSVGESQNHRGNYKTSLCFRCWEVRGYKNGLGCGV